MTVLAIADPPYLGRAARWYGDGRGSGRNQVRGRVVRKPDFHPAAGDWDRPSRHVELIEELVAGYDGFAIAAHQSSISLYSATLDRLDATWRMGVWARPNAIPGAGRVIASWEPVFYVIPPGRRQLTRGLAVRDYLEAPVQRRNFVGAKPDAWTRWVLALLGHRPDDVVVDIFTGSGAVARAIATPLDFEGGEAPAPAARP